MSIKNDAISKDSNVRSCVNIDLSVAAMLRMEIYLQMNTK